MTLIASIRKGSHQVALISDVALENGPDGIFSAGPTPLQAGFSRDYRTTPPPENVAIRSAVQKTIVFKRWTFQWAGSSFLARVAIEHLKNNLTRIPRLGLSALIWEALEVESPELHMIASKVSRSGAVETYAFQCTEISDGDVKITVAGDGEYRFIDEFTTFFGQGALETNEPIKNVMARLAYLIYQEITDDAAYYHNFGCAFEVVGRTGSQWRKFPYTVCIFDGRERFGGKFDYFGWASILKIAYSDDKLVVHSWKGGDAGLLDGFNGDSWRYLPTKVNVRDRLTYVIPPLGKWTDRPLSAHQLNIDPVFTLGIALASDVEDELLGWRAYMPGVVGIRQTFPQGQLLLSRAFFRRRMEKYYNGREFVPQPEYVDFYRHTFETWRAGGGLDDMVSTEERRRRFGR